MHKYTTEVTENALSRQNRNRYTLRHYFSEESNSITVCYILLLYKFLYYIINVVVVACRLFDMLVLFMFYIGFYQLL